MRHAVSFAVSAIFAAVLAATAEPPAYFSQLSYMTYVGPDAREQDAPLLAKYVQEMAASGVNTFVFVNDLGGVYGYSPTIWPAADRFDFSYLDRHMKTIIDAAGPQAKLVVQLYIDAPMWWCEQHPDEMMLLDNGKKEFAEKYFALPRTGPYPSIASTAWRDAMDGVIKEVVAHINSGPYAANVVGYQATGLKTQEWYHWSMNTPKLGDYSPPMLAAFRGWLRSFYANDEVRLRAAWHLPDASFDTAAIPSHEARYGGASTFRDSAKEQAVIDFHRFWQWIMLDTIEHFGATLRANGATSVGAFYGYSAEFAHLAEDAGHLGLRFATRNAPDYMMAPTSYYRRGLATGQGLLRTPRAGEARPGLVPWCDFDAASYLIKNKDQAALAPWIASMGVTSTAEEFGWVMRRQWVTCRESGAHMNFFDLHGGYYDDPAILAEVKALNTLNAGAGPPLPGGAPAQILVVLDEDSCHFVKFRDPFLSKLLVEQIGEFPFVAPFAFHVGPLTAVPAGTRLVVYLNQFKLSSEERARQQALLSEAHATAVYLFAPGYFAEDGAAPSVENIANTLGMKVRAVGRPAPGTKISLEGAELPLLDAEQFVVDDAAATTIAPAPGGGAAVARTVHDGVPTIFAATGPLPRAYLRGLAEEAGVHLYHDRAEDSVYCDGRYLALAAGATAGPRTLTFPAEVVVKDALTGAVLGPAGKTLTLEFRALEVRIFEYGTP